MRARRFGQDYAKTLAIWRNNFRAAWPNLMPLGLGNIDVRQVVFARSS
jgi:cyclopropane-fatty-acyl-phospholipid synthase